MKEDQPVSMGSICNRYLNWKQEFFFIWTIHLIGFYDYKMVYFVALDALISQFPTHPVHKIEFVLRI